MTKKPETLRERALERGPDRKEPRDYEKDHPPSKHIHWVEWIGIAVTAALLVWLFA